MFWALVIGVVWLTGFLTLPFQANGFWMPKAAVWTVGSWLIGLSCWWNPPFGAFRPNRWAGRLASWILVSFAIGFLLPQLTVPQTVVKTVNLPFNPWPISPFLFAMGSVLAVQSLIMHTVNPSPWRRIAWHLFLIGMFCALHGIAQVVWVDPLGFSRSMHPSGFYTARNAPIGVLGNPTLLGNFLALTAPFGLIFKPAWTRGGWLLMALAIALTKSATSVVGLVIGTLLVLWCQRRWRVLCTFLVLVLSLGFLMTFHHELMIAFFNPTARVEIWRRAWEFFATFPLNMWIGYGLGTIAELTTKGYWNYGTLHCEPLQILVELGFIGLFFSVMWMVTSLRSWMSLRHNPESAGWLACVVVFAFLACFGFPLRIAPLAMMGVLSWAALESFLNLKGGTYATT